MQNIKKRDDIIPVYVNLIRSTPSQSEVQEVNNFIINRWSKSALIYIKDKAWRIINKEYKNAISNSQI